MVFLTKTKIQLRLAAIFSFAMLLSNIFISTSSADICIDPTESQFCGYLTISPYTLTFVDIPESFNFGTIKSGSTSHICNNESSLTGNLPDPDCTLDGTPPPGDDDLLRVYDDRGNGGFQVTLSAGANSFTDGINSIPLTNLYMLTTLPATGTNIDGVNYDDATGEAGIYAPAYVDEFNPLYDISDVDTFTTKASVSQIGDRTLVLMDGTLSQTLGRNGYFSQLVNYYLKIDATQLPGNYALILSYDLMDSTTL
jgi:hypothetical protein